MAKAVARISERDDVGQDRVRGAGVEEEEEHRHEEEHPGERKGYEQHRQEEREGDDHAPAGDVEIRSAHAAIAAGIAEHSAEQRRDRAR